MYCKFHSLCIYLSCACDCFWVGVKGLSLKHVVHTKQNLRQLPLLSCFLLLLQYLCPVARDAAFWNTSCGCVLWFSILLVHTIFLMGHSSSAALHKFDKGNSGRNQTTTPLHLTLKCPTDLLVIDSYHNCRESRWAVTATAKPAYCAISAVSV